MSRAVPNGFEWVNAECAVLARLARDVALGAVAFREDGEENVVLGSDAKIGREIWSGLADECGLNEVIIFARRALDAFDGDLGVGVVVAVVVANANLDRWVDII